MILDIIDDYITPQEQEDHSFHAGDAYAFQGDERDVIILSMVVGRGRRFTSLTADTYRQRYNVAVSRARDQLILFHSVELGSDLTNQEDLRYQLLSYIQHGYLNEEEIEDMKDMKDMKDKCESPFEEEVYDSLIKRGYKVTPQVRVGQYRIDLVVEGEKERLAVECDGDRYHPPEKWWEDRLRQNLLERVGWTFWRISGSSFYRDKEESMKPILSRLKEMGIEPMYKLNEDNLADCVLQFSHR